MVPVSGSRSASKHFRTVQRLKLEGQIAGDGGVSTSRFAAHQTINGATRARLSQGGLSALRQAVHGSVDLLFMERKIEELGGSLTQAVQNEIRVVAGVQRRHRDA